MRWACLGTLVLMRYFTARFLFPFLTCCCARCSLLLAFGSYLLTEWPFNIDGPMCIQQGIVHSVGLPLLFYPRGWRGFGFSRYRSVIRTTDERCKHEAPVPPRSLFLLPSVICPSPPRPVVSGTPTHTQKLHVATTNVPSVRVVREANAVCCLTLTTRVG